MTFSGSTRSQMDNSADAEVKGDGDVYSEYEMYDNEYTDDYTREQNRSVYVAQSLDHRQRAPGRKVYRSEGKSHTPESGGGQRRRN